MSIPAIVSTEWLAANRRSADLVVLDASVEKMTGPDGARLWRPAADAFAAGHIPGARFADLATAFSDPDARFSFMRPSAARFAEAAAELAVTGSERIVVYDNSTGIWAARLWWLFRAFGHDDVAVLDGGIAAWRASGLPVETGPAAATAPGVFTARPRPGRFVDRADVEAIVAGDRPGLLACVLRPPVFAGTEQNYARPGHIPGSLNLPYGELVGPDNRFRPEAELRAALAPLLAAAEPVVLYCGGGITAAGTALLLTALGAPDVAVYDGSLEEWSADPSLPMALA